MDALLLYINKRTPFYPFCEDLAYIYTYLAHLVDRVEACGLSCTQPWFTAGMSESRCSPGADRAVLFYEAVILKGHPNEEHVSKEVCL